MAKKVWSERFLNSAKNDQALVRFMLKNEKKRDARALIDQLLVMIDCGNEREAEISRICNDWITKFNPRKRKTEKKN